MLREDVLSEAEPTIFLRSSISNFCRVTFTDFTFVLPLSFFFTVIPPLENDVMLLSRS